MFALKSINRHHVLIVGLAVLVGLFLVFWPFFEQWGMDEGALVNEETATAYTPSATFAPERVSFSVQFKDEVSPYRLMSIFVMPGEAVELKAVFTEAKGSAEIKTSAGAIRETGPEAWVWTAPDQPGLYPLHLTEGRAGETITLNAFVKVPFDHSQDALNGYRIGDYADVPLDGNPLYNEPDGFVEVTPENQEAYVSPHFQLKQFVCKQAADFPKYLILRERLLLKLEMLLEAVNERGIAANTFHVMSAFRTPFYNKSIGNRTTYSRHLYGGAADLFIDTDGDDYMDDLDDDGEVTVAEARWMAALVEEKTGAPWYQPFIGGLGIYSPAPHRGPFIHVDVRGQKARW